jgi:hypothetical protein
MGSLDPVKDMWQRRGTWRYGTQENMVRERRQQLQAQGQQQESYAPVDRGG